MLQVSELSLGYHSATPILRGCNFHVKTGTLTCLLGPSGVGKSSLLRVLAGLHRPLQGEVKLADQRITQPHRQIGFVFQQATLLPWLSVQQNVALALKVQCHHKGSKADLDQQIKAVLAEVGLGNHAQVKPHQLSGGMAQRVNLARALVTQPKLMLLDEPFSALDPIIRTQMQQLLRQIIHQHQMAAVMVTHDIDEALLIADQILLLGDKPARIIASWQLDRDFPRQDLVKLNGLRLEILQAMQQNEHNLVQQNTIEYMI